MRILLNEEDVERFAVEDLHGEQHSMATGAVRPFPYCTQCSREVEALAAVLIRGRGTLIYAVRCHGEEDVVRFRQDATSLVALPCFGGTYEDRQQMLTWLADGAQEGLSPN